MPTGAEGTEMTAKPTMAGSMPTVPAKGTRMTRPESGKEPEAEPHLREQDERPLTIVFVCEAIGNYGNGTSNSAVQYARELRRRGHTVRLVGVGSPDYPVRERYIPLVTEISHRQQMRFARVDDDVLRKVIDGADIVHCYLPFALEKRALRIARGKGVAVSAGYHLQPENVLYSAGPLRFIPGASRFIYWLERRYFFRLVEHLHVPTRMGAALLREHGYRNKLHVISNGYAPRYVPAWELERDGGSGERPSSRELRMRQDEKWNIEAAGDDGAFRHAPGTFRVLASGRLAGEKDQRTLLDAVALCRHRDSIEVRIAGKGPLREKLISRARELHLRNVWIGFVRNDLMPEFLRSGDLLVHCSIADLESLSVLEAIACGLVPVIADAPLSAAGQFSLCEQSSFPVSDAQALADRIDWWIEHPQERERWSREYARSAREHYSLQASVTKFEAMEREAIRDNARRLGSQD